MAGLSADVEAIAALFNTLRGARQINGVRLSVQVAALIDSKL
jgi:hypothetical protein